MAEREERQAMNEALFRDFEIVRKPEAAGAVATLLQP